MKASVSDSIASVSEKIKKTKNEADEAEEGESAEATADELPDQSAGENNEE